MVIAVAIRSEAAADNGFSASKLESGDIDLITDVAQVVAASYFFDFAKNSAELVADGSGPLVFCRLAW
jgi:hypothetical protein